MNTKTYHVRFLKAGLLEFYAPEDADILELKQSARIALDLASNQDLFIAMSDIVPSGYNPTRFDADSFQVEALEDPDSDHEYIYTTPLWDEYAGLKD